MSKVSVQWLTQDKDLFEFDWLTSLLEGTTDQVLVADNVSQLQLDKKVLLICNHAVPYRPFLDALRQNNSSYGMKNLSTITRPFSKPTHNKEIFYKKTNLCSDLEIPVSEDEGLRRRLLQDQENRRLKARYYNGNNSPVNPLLSEYNLRC